MSTTARTIISVDNLVKHYGHFEAVKGISFEVYEGEIFGLLGPNGAGKSNITEQAAQFSRSLRELPQLLDRKFIQRQNMPV